jgi:hypothetical protein
MDFSQVRQLLRVGADVLDDVVGDHDVERLIFAREPGIRYSDKSVAIPQNALINHIDGGDITFWADTISKAGGYDPRAGSDLQDPQSSKWASLLEDPNDLLGFFAPLNPSHYTDLRVHEPLWRI